MTKYRFSRRTANPLRNQIVDDIRAAIVQGHLQPGERVVEAELATQLGVPRSSIREAIRVLEQEGLLVSLPYRETRVATITESEVHEVLLPIRVTLETFAAREALAIMGEEDFARLAKIIESMRAAAITEDREAMARLDTEFHREIIERSGHATLGRIWSGIDARIRSHLLLEYVQVNLNYLVRIHEQLLAVLRARRPEVIPAAIHEHMYGWLGSGERGSRSGLPPTLPDASRALE